MGARLLQARARLIGISDGASRATLAPLVVEIARDAARYVGTPLTFAEDDVVLYAEYAREGYGVPNPGMIDAVHLVARTEGILLDPVYTGKAMAGLLDLVRQGVLERDQTVCFIHTGGTPALFAYRDCFV
jgi:1-aminocyclopropane-1-carboxylate deaminase/D-cysteine desulfhydrase-like pyridoxal-dependent ACC family enzyme